MLEIDLVEKTEQIRELMAREREMEQRIQELHYALEERSNEAAEAVRRLQEVETELTKMQLSQQATSCRSVQTEQSAATEVEKELNRQLMTREWNMKQYIQMLQTDLEKRCWEAVASAARLREIVTPSATPEQNQPSDEPKYKGIHVQLCYYKMRQ